MKLTGDDYPFWTSEELEEKLNEETGWHRNYWISLVVFLVFQIANILILVRGLYPLLVGFIVSLTSLLLILVMRMYRRARHTL